jgi:hypothetical protein
MIPLSNPVVNANGLETTVMALWQEFLAQYFDGNPHAVGAALNVPFPKAELCFQQSRAPGQKAETGSGGTGPGPLQGLSITMVWSEPGKRPTMPWELAGGVTQQMVYAPAHWNFWVRSSGTNARALGKEGADALYGLLVNQGETRSLAQAGIQRVRVLPPRCVQDADFTLRLVCASAVLRYPVMSQG